MVSKLWRALESPGELVKNTDALTPTYRLGLSRAGWGPRYMYFLTSSQMISDFSQGLRISGLALHHHAPFKTKVSSASHSYQFSSGLRAWCGPTPLYFSISLPLQPIHDQPQVLMPTPSHLDFLVSLLSQVFSMPRNWAILGRLIIWLRRTDYILDNHLVTGSRLSTRAT